MSQLNLAGVVRTCFVAMLSVLAAGLPGCAAGSAGSGESGESGGGPESIAIDSARYQAAFDAAIEAARARGMAPLLRDRRAGVIETEPALAGSLLEPWRTDGASFEQVLQNTIHFQRRRARFEFVPAGHDQATADLTEHHGPLELRVRVVLERMDQVGIRHNAWTRGATTTSVIIAGDPVDQLPSQFWTPVARDPAMEQRLLAAVDEAMRN